MGIRFNLITSAGAGGAPRTDLSKLDDVHAACGGAVDAFEGVNEPDLTGSPSWASTTIAAQRALYAAVKGNPAIRHLTVIGASPTWKPQELGDLSGAVDAGNWHPYPGGHCPTCGDPYGTNIDDLAPRYRAPSGSKPMIATETGYHNALRNTDNGHRPVDEATAAVYLPRLLLEYFNRGFHRTYLYELIDSRPDPGLADRDAHFGLLRNDGSEKPAYRAVRSLLGLLSDPGPTFSPGALPYTVSGASPSVHRTLLQKRDGTFLLALWHEAPTWDTGARANAPDDRKARRRLLHAEQRVRVQLAAPVAGATVHALGADGTMTSAPAPVVAGGVDVAVTDRVTVLELRPPRSAAPGGNAAPELTGVRISRRAFAPVPRRARHQRRGRYGAALRYALSEPATLRVAIERRRGGRRGKAARYRAAGTLRLHARAGRRSSRFTGRVGRRALAPGRYRARVVAVDSHGARSRARVVTFRIVRP
jgi:hypothetical protein